MHVIVAGAGVGGLTCALALRARGHSVEIVEAAPELGEVGAGIQIPPNAARVLDRLGVLERLETRAVRPLALEARMGRSGRRVFRIPLDGSVLARWGGPYLHVHRADYVAALRDAFDGPLHLGRRAVGYHDEDDCAALLMEDGSTLRADAVVAADGLRSALRAQMHGEESPRYTGNTAWRATVPVERLGGHAPDRTACVWMGPGRHAVTYRLRGGRLANIVGVVERDHRAAESWTERGTREDALEDFAGWHPVVTTLLERADTLHRWALYDRAPLSGWHKGRVALLGDAAHPMLPFMAQGAAMAVEDAWALADELREPVPEALARYTARRLARASAMQARSRANARTFHRRGLPAQLATYLPMAVAGRLLPGLVLSRLDAVYAHDETGSGDDG